MNNSPLLAAAAAAARYRHAPMPCRAALHIFIISFSIFILLFPPTPSSPA